MWPWQKGMHLNHNPSLYIIRLPLDTYLPHSLFHWQYCSHTPNRHIYGKRINLIFLTNSPLHYSHLPFTQTTVLPFWENWFKSVFEVYACFWIYFFLVKYMWTSFCSIFHIIVIYLSCLSEMSVMFKTAFVLNFTHTKYYAGCTIWHSQTHPTPTGNK